VALGLCALLAGGPALAEQSTEQAAEPVSVLARMKDALNAQSSVARHLLNECVLAGAAAAAVAVVMTGPVGPTAMTALGVVPDMSPYTIGAMGCGAGVVAGAASAFALYAWEDPAEATRMVTAPIVTAWNAVAIPKDWSIANLFYQGGQTALAAIEATGTGSALLAALQGTEAPAAPVMVSGRLYALGSGVARVSYRTDQDPAPYQWPRAIGGRH
jgi:hypothetical protein